MFTSLLIFTNRSAKEAEDNIRKALEKGQVLPKEERFDSNCITPGMDVLMLSYGIPTHCHPCLYRKIDQFQSSLTFRNLT